MLNQLNDPSLDIKITVIHETMVFANVNEANYQKS